MRTFQTAHPVSQIELHVGAPDEVSQRLLRGDADIGLKYAVAPEPGLQVEHAAAAPVLAVMRPSHVLALADVVRHPLLLGSRGVTARQLFDLACSAQGLRYEPVLASNFSSVMLSMLCDSDILLSGQLTVALLHLSGHS